jgi:hypothetical protein
MTSDLRTASTRSFTCGNSANLVDTATTAFANLDAVPVAVDPGDFNVGHGRRLPHPRAPNRELMVSHPERFRHLPVCLPFEMG